MEERELKRLYSTVLKPARYTGGEFNTPDMNKPDAEVRMCFCFPDVYEIGMSNLGLRILYHMLNERADCIAERCFMPWVDLYKKLKADNIPLTSVDTGEKLSNFDVLGFSIQYELAYTNVVAMLDLAGIPFFAKDRNDDYPLIIAGGPCMANPEPYADFFDAMTVGEGEESMNLIIDEIKRAKKEKISKSELLKRLTKIQGVIVPSLDKAIYEGGRIVGFTRIVDKAVVKDFDKAYFPTKILLPNVEIVHDRSVLELYRGCSNGCRFCQAGFYYRPIRSRSLKTLCSQGEELIKNNGFEELSLSSLSTGDYPGLVELIEHLKKAGEGKTKLSLPSLRVDSFESIFAEEARKSSLTFAPEAGTDRLRAVINKNITSEDIDKSMISAFKLGYTSVKLYFMLGLPTETFDDIEGIEKIVRRIFELYEIHKKTNRKLNVTVSTSIFIPKPVTPFQWERFISREEFDKKLTFLREKLRIRGVNYNWHDYDTSFIEAVLARGDRKLSSVIVEAFKLGQIFDSWSEFFDIQKWMQAFENCKIDVFEYLKEREANDLMPFEYIDCGIKKDYMIKERNLAYEEKTTKNCIDGCNGCGANKYGRCSLCC